MVVTFARVWNRRVRCIFILEILKYYFFAVTVEVKALQISDSLIELRVNCTEQLPTEIDSLTVTLTSYGSEKSTSYSQNISLPCPKTMRFSELTPDTTFSVKLVWYEHVLPAAIIECALDNNYTTSAGKEVHSHKSN